MNSPRETGGPPKSQDRPWKKHKRNEEESETLNVDSTEPKPKKKKKEKNWALHEESETLISDSTVKGVVVTGKDVKDSKYRALDSFADSGLLDEVLDCCKNFSKPWPIQANSWPFLLNGRDLIGLAASGSG